MPAFAADRALPPQAPQNWAHDWIPDPQRLQVQVATRAEHEALSHILAMLLMTLPRPLSPDAECAPFAAAAAAAPPARHHSPV